MSSPASSSSLPPHPSTASPFSLLPTELIQSIIESTVPHSFNSQTYESRQSTLCSLCLVSKLFHQVAKPLLYAVVQLTKDESFQLWTASRGGEGGGAGEHGRELLFDLARIQIPTANFSPYLPSSLTTLVLNGGGEVDVDLTMLSKLTSLSTLRLWALRCKMEVGVIFESLIELGLISVGWTKPFAEILNPTTFPRLKAFAWRDYNFNSDMAASLLSFSDQLDVFSADAHDAPKWPPELRRRLERKTLFDYQFGKIEGEALPSLPFVRMYGLPAQAQEVDVSTPFKLLLMALAYLVRNSEDNAFHFLSDKRALSSLLYLPSHLGEASFAAESVKALRPNFKTECERKKIEVRFEDQVGDWEWDSAISDDFWRRMKERKKALGAGNEE